MARIALAIASAALIAGACGTDDGTPVAPPTEQNIVGTWSLSNVNGSLPYRVGGDGTRVLDIVSGSFEVRSDKTFSDVVTTRFSYVDGMTDPVVQTSSESGTWALIGRFLELRYPAGVVADTAVVDTAGLTGSLLHRSDGGLVFTYRR
jgi:hypothetical protein